MKMDARTLKTYGGWLFEMPSDSFKEVFLKKNHGWVFARINYILNAAFIVAYFPILMWKIGMLPTTTWILFDHWFVIALALAIFTVTMIRWVKKVPTPLTWFHACWGAGAMNVCTGLGITLLRFYLDPGRTTDILAALIGIPGTLTLLLAAFLSLKALKGRFFN